MKASDYIVQFLRDRKVEVAFGYSGGAITHLMDSLNKMPGIRFLQTYHEQTAAIAAEAYSWLSGTLGVAVATSGPGATNMITGIADAYFDSIPALYITGQVNTFEYKGDKPIRQQGFQETDIVSIVKPVTKYAALVTDPNRLRYELEKAWALALEGRQGPALLDIPMDVQRAEIDPASLEGYNAPGSAEGIGITYLGDFSPKGLAGLIASSRRPIFLLGGGVPLSGATDAIRELAMRVGVPVVTSLLGKGAFPEDSNLSMGMIGSYGNRCANIALANADLVLAIGTRLDTRQTGTRLDTFVPKGRVVRVDVDEAEILHHRLSKVDAVLGSATVFVESLSAVAWGEPRLEWLQYLASLKISYNQDAEIERNIQNKRPYEAMDILNRYATRDQIYTADIGQNQMFAAQKIRILRNQSWKTSGGLAPMGYALPAAIGAAFATKGARAVFAITGDGGLHMAMQSLLLISQYKLPIKIVLLNNRSLGMITQFQDLYFDSRKEGTTKESGYLVPDFRLLAQSCFLPYHLFHDEGYEDEASLAAAFTAEGPALIEFDIGEKTVVYPKLEVNMPIEEPNPRLSSEELARLMIREK